MMCKIMQNINDSLQTDRFQSIMKNINFTIKGKRASKIAWENTFFIIVLLINNSSLSYKKWCN